MMNRLALGAIALAAVSVFAGIGLGVFAYIPVPFADMVDFYGDFYELGGWGGLTFDQLWHKHNEHRIFIPKLWFLADLIVTNGTQKLLFVVNVLSAGLHAGLLIYVFQRQSPSWNALMIFASLAFVSAYTPSQYENFISGFQVQFIQVWLFASLAFAALILAVDEDERGNGGTVWFFASILFGLASSLSMANGIAVWPLLLILAIWRGVRLWQVGVIALFGAAIVAYEVMDFEAPRGHGDPAETIGQIGTVLRYVTRYVTAGFEPIGSLGQEIIGGLSLVALLLFSIRAILRHKQSDGSVGFFLALAAFVVAAALLTALGRAKFGLGQASSSRYVTPAMIYWVALSGLAYEYFHETHRPKWVLAGLALGVLFLTVVPFVDGVMSFRSIWANKESRIAAISGYLGGAYVEDRLRPIYPWPIRAHRVLGLMDKAGTGPFAVLDQFRPSQQALSATYTLNHPACIGSVDFARAGPLEGLFLYGWAADQESKEYPRWVFALDEEKRIQAWGRVGIPRFDVGKALGTRWIGRGFSVSGPWSGDSSALYSVLAVFDDGRKCVVATQLTPKISQDFSSRPPRHPISVSSDLGWRTIAGSLSRSTIGPIKQIDGKTLRIGNFTQGHLATVAAIEFSRAGHQGRLALAVRTSDYPMGSFVVLKDRDSGKHIDEVHFKHPAPVGVWLLLSSAADGQPLSENLRIELHIPGGHPWAGMAVSDPFWID